jgi:hypothetical protein
MFLYNKQQCIAKNLPCHPINTKKFLILQCMTLGVYSFYWWYRNWICLDTHNDKTTSRDFLLILCKTFCSPIFCYQFFHTISCTARNYKTPYHWDPFILSLVYTTCHIILALSWLDIIAFEVFIWFGGLSILALLPVQLTINSIYQRRFLERA